MNAEELRDTTLDPANRTLCQVTMDDAGAADELFRILMGDKVEPRREFIEKHALEVAEPGRVGHAVPFAPLGEKVPSAARRMRGVL